MGKGSLQTLYKTCEKEASFILLCLVVVLLFAGAGYAYYLDDILRYWDEEHYLLLAQNLRKGIYSFNGTDPTAFQPPGYPLALYILSWISENLIFLRFANFIFLCGAILLLFWMLKKEEGRFAAVTGAVIASVYPLFFYSAGTFYPQILASALFMLTLSMILSSSRYDWKGELAIGIVLGFLFLVVPSFLLYLPLWGAYPWFTKRVKRWRAAALLLVASFAIVGCWTARNALTFERFVLISSNSGINLLLGNSDATTPEAGVNANLDTFVHTGEKMNEFDQDDYYKKEAYRWIWANPLRAFQLYLLKGLNFFNFKNELASKSEESILKDALSFLSYYPVLLLALLRLAMAWKYPLSSFEWYLALFLLASPFLQAIFFTRIRFRIPFDFLAIYFAACSLQLFIGRSVGNGTEEPGHDAEERS